MDPSTLFKQFQTMPPGLRVVLGLAGITGLGSLIMFLFPGLFSPRGRMVLLAAVGVGLLIYGIIYLLRRRRSGKQSNQLAGALSSQGPTRGDIAEQEQVYRDKFKSKLGELKTNGLSVYKLPWFVLMGEPGCGKTASLIHSGLDFPLGKDEVPGFGGTRNYNWWFTNEAVILDTAGRIAFQEEGTTDKPEWEYFLKLLRRNRPNCPVNGVVIALPADKLLRDSSEERATKASVLRDRLRQIHQHLGVRFPTFILVTKMDLIAGFREFFEEIRVDLQQRNQMFGWSRPGSFEETYDPATFPAAFDQVYTRLRDWSMRYLNRKATENELGMIVTFPEAFRQLGGALNDFVSTIFQKSPLLEPPFFRGFYFTSAVQEGAPLMDIFARTRSGLGLSDRPVKAVDSKAFFIHDFYAKKVFPEQGLVFRSAKHVSLNRRARAMVYVGSGVMAGLMAVIFLIGSLSVTGLVKKPREDCTRASERIDSRATTAWSPDVLQDNVKLASELRRHVDAYGGAWSWWAARFLYIGASIREPQGYVQTIHTRFVLDCILRPVYAEAGRLLRDTPEVPTDAAARKRYIDALAVYSTWYGEFVGQRGAAPLSDAELSERSRDWQKLLEFLNLGETDRRDAAVEFEAALRAASRQPRTFAVEILRGGKDDEHRVDPQVAGAAIQAAVARIGASWSSVANLSETSSDPRIAYWPKFLARVKRLQDAYVSILRTSARFDGADAAAARGELLALTEKLETISSATRDPAAGEFVAAYQELRAFLERERPPQTDGKKILTLEELLKLLQGQWNAEFDVVNKSLERGAPDRAGPARDEYAAVERERTRLSEAFDKQLGEFRLSLGLPEGAEPLNQLSGLGLLSVRQNDPPSPAFQGDAQILLSPTALGPEDRVAGLLAELRDLAAGDSAENERLKNLDEWPLLLSDTAGGAPASKLLGAWFTGVSGAAGATPEGIAKAAGLDQHAFWRPVDLLTLSQSVWRSRQSGTVERIMATMARLAQEAAAADDMPGVGRLRPGFDAVVKGLPFERNEFNTVAAAPRVEQPAERPAPRTEDPPESDRPRRGRLDQPTAPEPAAEDAPAAREGTGRIADERAILRQYHTRAYLTQTMRSYVTVRKVLRDRKDVQAAQNAANALDEAAKVYAARYFTDWNSLYSDPRVLLPEEMLKLLVQCRDGTADWAVLNKTVRERGRDIGRGLRERMEALANEVVLFSQDLKDRDPIDTEISNLLDATLNDLNKRNASLPDRLADVLTALGRVEQRNPVAGLALQVSQSWDRLCTEITNLDESAKPAAGGAFELPGTSMRKQLSDALPGVAIENFGLTAPMLDMASHSTALLRHKVDERFYAEMRTYASRYPLAGDVSDSSANLSRLNSLAGSSLSGEEVVEMLKKAVAFQRDYGPLLESRALYPDAAAGPREVLKRCEEWARFLFSDPSMVAARPVPDAMDVTIGIAKVQDETVLSAGAGYDTVEFTLPLLDPGGESRPAAPISYNVRTDGRDNLVYDVAEALSKHGKRYRWQYAPQTAQKLNPARAKLKDRIGSVNPSTFPESPQTTWELPERPASLLLLLASDSRNRRTGDIWIVPIRMSIPAGTIGYDIGIKFERSFPGSIPTPADAGPTPRMERAARYLSGPRG